MQTVDHIKLFEYFYSQLYNKEFKYYPSKKEITTIDKFNSQFDNPSLGINWLFKYYAFQFEYWSKKNYRKYNSILLSYIIGIKAIDRYNNRLENWEYFTDKFIEDYKLTIPDFYKKDFSQLCNSEEIDKQRYPDGKERLANCLIHTTLYNKKSKICVLCSKSVVCKKIQEVKYLDIYKLRNK